MPTFFSLTDQPLPICIRIGTIPGRLGYTILLNGKKYDTSEELRLKVEGTPGFSDMSSEQKSALVLSTYMDLAR